MSYYDDYMTEAEALSYNDECCEVRYIWADPEDIRNHIWTQRNGKRCHISKLETRHILNIINFLRRRHCDAAYEWTEILEEELIRRRSAS